MRKKTKVRSRKSEVSIWDDPRTRAAQTLAYHGFTMDTIRRACDLTQGQVTYRLRKLGVSTVTYRLGKSEEAQTKIATILHKERLVIPRRYSHWL